MYTPPNDQLSQSIQLCSQCQMYHPPLRQGEICPMKKDKDELGNEVDFQDFFIFLKSAISTKIQKNKIKDSKKMLSSIKIQLYKIVEDYNEYDNGSREDKKNL